MNFPRYQFYLRHYVDEAIQNSDGSNRGISEYLWTLQVKGIYVRERAEKERALTDTRRAFDEHRHWPLPIILSHLGLEPAAEK